MSLLEDQLTTLTDAHTRVIKWLERHGVQLMEEVPFPPYQADIYVPRFHAVIEVDGPQHSEKDNNRRDLELWTTYQVPTLRVPHDATEGRLRGLLLLLLDFEDDAETRLASAKLRLPWL